MAKNRAKRPVAISDDDESSDEELAYKPAGQRTAANRTARDDEKKAKASPPRAVKQSTLAVKSRPSSTPASDDDDGSSGSREASRVAASQYSADDDKAEDDDDDRDEWRIQNRTVRDKVRTDPKYAAQVEKWNKFRTDFPIPLRAALSAGAILALRKQLKSKKKLVLLGIPIDLRRDAWELLSGARAFPEKLEHSNRFQFYLKHPPNATITKQIAQDVNRALKGHMKFSTKTGQAELTRVLSAMAVRVPAIGYANSMAHIAGFLLLFYSEERAFWMLCTLVDIILPPDYYTNSLLGARADAQLVKILVFQRLPKLHAHLDKYNQDVSIIALRWLMPLFLTTLPIHVCIRLFDVLMLDGSNFFLSVALALFHLHSKKLLSLTDEVDLIEYIDKIGTEEKSLDSDEIINTALASKCSLTEEELKRREMERRIMETAYMKDLQVTQKFRRVEEERKRKEEEARKKEMESEELSLSYGTEMIKIGASGKPRKTMVYLKNETPAVSDREKRIYTLTWDSKSKAAGECRMLLRDCCLYTGFGHGQFVKRPDAIKPYQSKVAQAFSIVSPMRSLDLITVTAFDTEEWLKVLMRIPMKKKPEMKKQNGVMSVGNERSDDENDHTEKKEPTTRRIDRLKPTSSADSIGYSMLNGKAAVSIGGAKGGAANNKLAALLAAGPPSRSPGNSDEDDDSPRVMRRKR